MVFDKRVGNSRRRPDILLKRRGIIVIVECDERQHKGSKYQNQYTRDEEILENLEAYEVFFIRFNPDSYTARDGTRYGTCFKMMKTKQVLHDLTEWERRMDTLFECIDAIFNQGARGNHFKLFYDE